MFRKLLTILLTAVISMSCCVSTASAAVIEESISPLYLYTDSCYAILTFSGTRAKCETEVMGGLNVTKIVINQTLQRKDSSGRWQFIAHWNETDTGRIGNAVNYQYNLTSGTYRILGQTTVFTASGFEPITFYSLEETL